MTPDAIEQTTCCAHATPLLCDCPQGFKSHARPLDEDECACGTMRVTDVAWRNCSGMTHVFQVGAIRCGCGARYAGRPTP